MYPNTSPLHIVPEVPSTRSFDPRKRRSSGALPLLTALALCASPLGDVEAQDDYAPSGGAWNSLTELMLLAQEAGLRVDTPDRVDVGDLGPQDALLLVAPSEELPLTGLASFMRAGGRVALADDFGDGATLLQLYHIRRSIPDAEGVPRLRDNENLLVARPLYRHPLTEGVGALVTNHPTVVHHPELQPLIALDDPHNAVVLTGAVGEGRLVVLGDPSVLIDNMLQFHGNRRLASNLLAYLDGGRGGRIVVASGSVEVVGRYGSPSSDEPLERLRAWLGDAAGAEVPPAALVVMTLVLCSILLLVATTSLPRRSPYEGASMLPPPAEGGGFTGRVSFFARRKGLQLHPALVYKFELEGELVRLLGLEGRSLLRDVLTAARAHGLPESEVAALRALLLELDRLRDRQDLPPSPPTVDPAMLRRMVETGERILAKLEAGNGS